MLITTYFSQGSAATDLRGGDSKNNSNFLHRFLINLTVKKIMKIGPSLSKLYIARQSRPGTFDTPCITAQFYQCAMMITWIAGTRIGEFLWGWAEIMERRWRWGNLRERGGNGEKMENLPALFPPSFSNRTNQGMQSCRKPSSPQRKTTTEQ